MKNFAIVLITTFIGVSMYAQDLKGKLFNVVKKDYDWVYVFPGSNKKLQRFALMKDLGFGIRTSIGYKDQSGMIVISLGDEYGFVPSAWRDEMDTTDVSSLSEFSDGVAAIMVDSSRLIGFINETGEWVIPPKYNQVSKFNEGLAYYAILEYSYDTSPKSNKVGYMNKKGEVVFELPEKLIALYAGCYFHGGVMRNGIAIMSIRESGFDCNCWGIIVVDKTGKIINYTESINDAEGNPIKLD